MHTNSPISLGNIPANSTIYIPFSTYDINGINVSLTPFTASHIQIYKNGGSTPRASTNGFSILFDLNANKGINGFSIDLSNNSDPGFYSQGSFYWVVIQNINPSSTVTILAATFRIIAAENTPGLPLVEAGSTSTPAATFSQFLRYNYANEFYVPLTKRGSADFAVSADWTPVGGDVKISQDGGAAVNITTLPTAITSGNGAIWKFQLTAAELKAKKIMITIVDTLPKAVNDQVIQVLTYGDPNSGLAFFTANQIGTATAATTNSVTLQSPTGLVAVDPTGMSLSVLSTNQGLENRVMESFDSGTLIATSSADFSNTPSGTEITYALYPFGATVSTDPADKTDVANILTAVSDVPDSVWATIIDGTRSAAQLFRGCVAVLFGKTSIAGSVRSFRDVSDTKNVVSATVNSGDRTVVTTDLS